MTDAFDPARFVAAMTRMGHNGAVGIDYVRHGDDWVELALPWRQELAADAGSGVFASGPIFTLMDMATSMGTWLKSRQFRPQATLDMRVDYLRPAIAGRTVIGRGECYRITRSVAFVRGEAHDGDAADPVAHVAGTFVFTRGI